MQNATGTLLLYVQVQQKYHLRLRAVYPSPPHK